jgi:hypothetical protein
MPPKSVDTTAAANCQFTSPSLAREITRVAWRIRLLLLDGFGAISSDKSEELAVLQAKLKDTPAKSPGNEALRLAVADFDNAMGRVYVARRDHQNPQSEIENFECMHNALVDICKQMGD